ncbi:MAG: sigma-54 dependent transcriptional regulator [Acidobacteria bacterium]|nr:sigma-54 dependent transcriptional regulator [Acidobacteriota bacterium]
MPNRREKVLVLDRDPVALHAVAEALGARGYSVEAPDPPELRGLHLALNPYAVAIVDLEAGLAQEKGLRLLSVLKQELPETEIIVTVSQGSIEAAVEAMREGAYDYLLKPLDLERLPVLVERALERRRLADENRRLRLRLTLKDEYGKVVGKSARISSVYEIAAQVAATNATVLLTGESGTGKELVAQAIHRRSDRRDRPFISINCGALPEGLLESELFGFERGAFTGAVEAKPGKFELAHGGTLLLDEVGEMSPKTQVEFLRVLQEKEFRRLGGERLIRVDVRIIASTNKDLLEEVKAANFRQDLYYRLAVVPIHLPPLRERPEDIPLLVDSFFQEFAEMNRKPVKRISREALDLLIRYHWPGNIRELRNVVERMTVIVDSPVIRPEHLPREMTGGRIEKNGSNLHVPLGTPLKRVEELVIRRTIEEVGGHREKAARLLGISPRTLQYKIARYGLARRPRPAKKQASPQEPSPAPSTRTSA